MRCIAGVYISCLLSGILAFPYDVFSQPVAPGFTYEYWDQEDGLPTSGISGLASLNDGYIWLTTFNGLARFNGIARQDGPLFSIINKSNTKGFSTNRIWGIHPAGEEEYFLTTEQVAGAENIIHYKDGAYKSYGYESGLRGDVNKTAFDDEGNFWVANTGRLLRFKQGRWTPWYEEIGLGIVHELHIRDSLNMWIRFDETLVRIEDGESTKIGVENGLQSNRVIYTSMKSSGDLWVNTTAGIHVIRDDSVYTFELPGRMSSSIGQYVYEDEYNPERLIIHLKNENYGIFYNGEFQLIPVSLIDNEGRLQPFELPGPESLQNSVKSWVRIGNKLFYNNRLVFQGESMYMSGTTDEQGGFWIVDEGRLYRFQKALFRSYDEQRHGITNIYPVFEDSEGAVWAANLHEQIFRTQQGREFEQFDLRLPDQNFHRFYSIYEDDKRNLWFGHYYGVVKWDRVFDPVNIQGPLNRDNIQVRAIYQDSDGILWFGTRRGIFSRSNEGEWKHVTEPSVENTPEIRVIFEDSGGRIWFGTNGRGLFYYDKQLGAVQEFEQNNRLSDTIIRSIYQDRDGVYWIGMEGGGLNRIEITAGEPEITHYTKDSGLFGSVIHSILEDHNNRLWMSSNTGVFWVHRPELNEYALGNIEQIGSTVYDISDGLPGNEANGGMQSTGIERKNGEFWFSMVNGIAVVDPGEVEAESNQLTMKIEHLITEDSTYSNIIEAIKLDKDQRDLQFSYIGYNYSVKPENVQFRYRLRGYVDQWNFAGSRREAFYTNIPAGEYHFEVQATVSGGNWELNSTQIAIVIAPFFYETPLFYAFAVMFVFGAGFLFYRWRIHSLEERERKLAEKVDQQTHQLKEQAERLQELDKAKSRFFANVSHEFRTPLTLTIGPLEDLRKKYAAENVNGDEDKVNLALRNSKRLLKLINQILDISKLESGSMELQLSRVNISEMLKQLCLAFSGLAERKGIRFDYKLPEGEITIMADSDMLEKVFVNLFSNAFKFTPPNGRVKVELAESEADVCIRISDTGQGIRDEDLPKIFERFYQTDESGAAGTVGTGIGLSLTKELVELHKGLIQAESKHGKGSVFEVRFRKGTAHFTDEQLARIKMAVEYQETEIGPIETDMDSQTSEKETPVDPEEDRTTILIIDDNAEIRAYLREHLKIDYQILESNNGRNGLETAVENLPDIIICDVMMPGMDGYEFCKALKSNEETDFIPVILLTAKAGQTDKLEGLGIGADDYIIKPFDIEEVKVRAANLIRSRKILKERFSTANGFSLHPGSENITSVDQQFLQQLQEILDTKIEDEDFNVEKLASEAAMSRSTLHKKIQAVLDKTPTDMIRDFRLEKARQLLLGKAGTVSEVAYSVGFKSIAHFSRAFKSKYGQTPRAFLKQQI